MTRPLLEIRGMSAGYGHVNVLHGVDLEVNEGEIVALIGANGAGKSTLLKTVVGLIPAASGSIRFDGHSVAGIRPEQLVRHGVALAPEGRWLFGPMTVRENLVVGATALPAKERRAGTEAGIERVWALFPVLRERAEQPAQTLSGGEQQMLAVARALMSRPRLLLLDEPSFGLAPRVIGEIFSALDVLRSDGVTVLLVEQDARLALKHADHGAVMASGRVVMAGPASELLADDSVKSIYLGVRPGEGERRDLES